MCDMIIGTAQKKDKQEVINRENEKKTMEGERVRKKRMLEGGRAMSSQVQLLFPAFKQ